jgi:VWFA-related protein
LFPGSRRRSLLFMRKRASLLLGLLAIGTRPAPAQDRPGSFREQARVERVVVDAYVLDSHGDPIRDLTSCDFRLRVDGKPAVIESAEWIPADQPEALPSLVRSPSGALVPSAPEMPPGRLLIFFFQTDQFVVARLHGLMRMALQARQMLDTLLPTDRVAVLSFDSHLKLRQDFTADHAKLERAIQKAILTGPPPDPDPEAFPSLARSFDFVAAKKAITPEKALAIISKAAIPIVGAKSMVFFGWGLQTIGGASGPNPKDTRDFREAIPALTAARISIFTLDITDADYHSLEGTLENISDITGGTYQKTHIFPRLAIERVSRAISGHYEIVFAKPNLPRGWHGIDVALVARKGRILARAAYED